jgi:hypothetical protein
MIEKFAAPMIIFFFVVSENLGYVVGRGARQFLQPGASDNYFSWGPDGIIWLLESLSIGFAKNLLLNFLFTIY